jgi:multidrug efflux pump subunit AcrA (membrane-fusion protein)
VTTLDITLDGQSYQVELEPLRNGSGEMKLRVNGRPVQVILPPPSVGPDDVEWMVVGDRPREINFDPLLRWLGSSYGLHRLEVRDMASAVSRPRSGDGRVKAPIPGLITRVLVSEGEAVAAGQPLLTLEAMKMENEIPAPFAGVVRSLAAAAGQSVTRDELLAEIG